MTKDEALKLALEALENGKRVRNAEGGTKYQPDLEDQAITAIKQALAAPDCKETGVCIQTGLACFGQSAQPAPVQEPVAYLCENAVGHKYFRWKKPSSTYKPIALYTTPPAAQRQWVGLTDEDKLTVRRMPWENLGDLMDNTEAILKESNNG